jgi:hypothetical protein
MGLLLDIFLFLWRYISKLFHDFLRFAFTFSNGRFFGMC